MYVLIAVYLSTGFWQPWGFGVNKAVVGSGVAVGQHLQFNFKSDCEAAADNLKAKFKHDNLVVLTECQYVR